MDQTTLETFAFRIMNEDIQTDPNYVNEDFKDLTILNILGFLPCLEELNLNNQNLGDYFLKKLSHKLDYEAETFLNSVKIFKLRDNNRFTSVGLKYLYCTAVRRKDIGINHNNFFLNKL